MTERLRVIDGHISKWQRGIEKYLGGPGGPFGFFAVFAYGGLEEGKMGILRRPPDRGTQKLPTPLGNHPALLNSAGWGEHPMEPAAPRGREVRQPAPVEVPAGQRGRRLCEGRVGEDSFALCGLLRNRHGVVGKRWR